MGLLVHCRHGDTPPIPVEVNGYDMYLTATIDPVPTMCMNAKLATAQIDDFVEDVQADINATDVSLKFFHLNPKPLKKVGKRDCVARQLKREVFMATFPEARSKETGVTLLRPFAKVASVAAEGNFGGCEAWFNLTIPIGKHDGQLQFLQPENVSIALAKPRLLIVTLRTSLFDAMAVCIHAPDSSWKKEEIEYWWDTTYADMEATIPNGYIMLCGADMNMRVG